MSDLVFRNIAGTTSDYFHIGNRNFGFKVLNGKLNIKDSEESDFVQLKDYNFYEESEQTTSVASTSYVNKIDVNTDFLNDGDYRLSWYCEVAYSKKNELFYVRTSHYPVTISEVSMEAVDVSSWVPFSGFKIISGISGVNRFLMSIRSSKKKSTAYIRRARIELRSV